MEQESQFFVRVSCMTYNHEPYITDALNGFVMQQTSFPFVCTLIDDAMKYMLDAKWQALAERIRIGDSFESPKRKHHLYH